MYPTVLNVRLLFTRGMYSLPITAIFTYLQISTAAKDGTCKIWNVMNGIMVCDVPSVLGLPGSGVAHKQNSKIAAGPIKMECRGCW